MRASSTSSAEQHPLLSLPPLLILLAACKWCRRICTPITSYPCSSSSAAVSELSTPPLMATTTRFPFPVLLFTSVLIAIFPVLYTSDSLNYTRHRNSNPQEKEKQQDCLDVQSCCFSFPLVYSPILINFQIQPILYQRFLLPGFAPSSRANIHTFDPAYSLIP